MIIEDVVLESGLYGSLWKMKFTNISKYIQKYSLIYSMLEYNYEQYSYIIMLDSMKLLINTVQYQYSDTIRFHGLYPGFAMYPCHLSIFI